MEGYKMGFNFLLEFPNPPVKTISYPAFHCIERSRFPMQNRKSTHPRASSGTLGQVRGFDNNPLSSLGIAIGLKGVVAERGLR
jgi:hypothetical protein